MDAHLGRPRHVNLTGEGMRLARRGELHTQAGLLLLGVLALVVAAVVAEVANGDFLDFGLGRRRLTSRHCVGIRSLQRPDPDTVFCGDR